MCEQAEHGLPPAHSDRRDGGHIRDLHWFVVCTEYAQERLAQREASQHDIQTFLPLIRTLAPQGARSVQRITQPAFPGYLFALCPLRGWHPLKRCRGIASLLHAVGERDAPAAMPPGIVEAWMARASEAGVLEDLSVPEVDPPPAGINVDATVRVTAGPFTGFEGLVQRVAAERVVVLLSLFGRQGPAEFKRSQVEPV